MVFALANALIGAATVTGVVSDSSGPVASAAVWLEGGAKAQPVHASVVQKGKKFSPHILIVPVGSSVDFPNRDDIFHNVFAEYNAKKFDLGMFPKGQSKSVVFDKPGTVSVLCNVHSEMSAYILVVDSDRFGVTDKAGRFSLAGVSPGKYKVHAWHETRRTAVREIKVGATNESLQLTISR